MERRGGAGIVREDERRAPMRRDRIGRRGGIATEGSKIQAECRTAYHNISFCACKGLLVDDILKLCLCQRVLEEAVEAVDDLLNGERAAGCASAAMIGLNVCLGHCWGWGASARRVGPEG